MEIDKKIIKKLIETLEDLKKSLKDQEIINNEETVEEEIDISSAVVKSPIVGTAYLLLNQEPNLLFHRKKN